MRERTKNVVLTQLSLNNVHRRALERACDEVNPPMPMTKYVENLIEEARSAKDRELREHIRARKQWEKTNN